MTDLKPCPFCGENVVEVIGDEYNKFFVGCAHCWVLGPLADTKAEAERLWNSRAEVKGDD